MVEKNEAKKDEQEVIKEEVGKQDEKQSKILTTSAYLT
jgi:chaperone BCS1